MAVLGLVDANGHEVGHLGDAVAIERTGDEHVRVGQVHLLHGARGVARAELETAAVLGVEQGGEDRRGAEVRIRHEVNRPVRADQRHGVQVTDDPVVLDREVPAVAHGALSPPQSGQVDVDDRTLIRTRPRHRMGGHR